MSKPSETLRTCQKCGATIYPEMINAGTAAVRGDALLCPHCLREADNEGELAPISFDAGPAASPAAPAAAAQPARPPQIRHGGTLGAVEHERAQHFRRPLLTDSPHATRCRTFHCKMSDAAFAHLNDQVNEWVDAHDDIEIKFATSSVGVVEGKHAEPHLVVTIFY